MIIVIIVTIVEVTPLKKFLSFFKDSLLSLSSFTSTFRLPITVFKESKVFNVLFFISNSY